MKTICLILLACSAFSFSGEIKEFKSLTIGTNKYEEVTLKKLNAAEALLKFDHGLTVVRIEDIPEPTRSEWYDKEAAAKFDQDKKAGIEKEKQAQEAKANQRFDAAAAQKRVDLLRAEIMDLQARIANMRMSMTGKQRDNSYTVGWQKQINLKNAEIAQLNPMIHRAQAFAPKPPDVSIRGEIASSTERAQKIRNAK
jgi:hypothetical protein